MLLWRLFTPKEAKSFNIVTFAHSIEHSLESAEKLFPKFQLSFVLFQCLVSLDYKAAFKFTSGFFGRVCEVLSKSINRLIKMMEQVYKGK